MGSDRGAQARRVLMELRGEGPDRVVISAWGHLLLDFVGELPKQRRGFRGERHLARRKLISRVGYERIRRLHDVQHAGFVLSQDLPGFRRGSLVHPLADWATPGFVT